MPEDPPTPPVTPAPVVTPEPDAPKTFTQEQLDRIVGKGKAEAEKAALLKLQEDTGLPVEKLKELAKTTLERQAAEKTELDKLKEANAALTQDSLAKVSEAQKELHTERVKAQLLKAKVPLPEEDDKVDAALDRLVSLVQAQPGSSVEDIREDIKSLKEQFPQLFAASEASKQGLPSSLPSGKPQQQSAGKSGLEYGMQLATTQAEARGIKPAS